MAGKLKFFSVLFALAGLLSCKTSQMSYSSAPTVGMFKVAILYPNGDDKTFDMDYYEKKHMPAGRQVLAMGQPRADGRSTSYLSPRVIKEAF